MDSEPAPSVKAGFFAYPEARKGPNTGYEFKEAANPVMRGWPLALGASLTSLLPSYLGSFLFNNAGFSNLRQMPLLNLYEPRHDPTVIPLNENKQDPQPASVKDLSLPAVDTNSTSTSSRHTSASAYHAAYLSGTLTPTAVIEALLEVIDSSPPNVHAAAWSDIRRTRLLAKAAASTARYASRKPLSALDGIPMGIKDEIDVTGHATKCGSTRDFTSPRGLEAPSSFCVSQLEDVAGVLIVGKTNMHEMGLDTTNLNPLTSTPLNPHNRNYYTGGSSGGSAYAVASGLVVAAHGVDGGGSIRIPSSFCGLYGLKPSHRRVSRHPTISLASSCTADGPMASNMADLELAYRIMAVPNPVDSLNSLYTHPFQHHSSVQRQSSPSTAGQSQKKTIGIFKDWFDSSVVDPAVARQCRLAIQYLVDHHNYTVQEISIPHLIEGQKAHALTILGECATAFPTPATWSGFSAALRVVLAVGAAVPGYDFLQAQKLRSLLMQHLAWLWKEYPGMLIVTPTVPRAGWFVEKGSADLKGGMSDGNRTTETMSFVHLANFTGCPAISVPVGMLEAKEGELAKGKEAGHMPVGLMAMGEWGDEEGLIRLGKETEEWAWTEGGVKKPVGWVDLMAKAKERMKTK